MTAPKNPPSFKTQLFLRISIAGFIFAIVAAFAYSYLASSMMRAFYQREGLQATKNFAQLSELTVLYESGENAIEAARTTLEFPGIEHVIIVGENGKVLLQEGNALRQRPLISPDWSGREARIIYDDSNFWQMSAPVYLSIDEDNDQFDMLDVDTTASRQIGYVMVQVSKSELNEFQNSIFVRNLIIGSVYGIAFALVFYVSLSRLLKPINKLTKVMGLSTEGSYTMILEDTQSSREVSKISRAYNHMINTLADRDRLLRNQRDLLETEVALRTNELVEARDTALQANQHKSEFLANVTHELRTPLQSILGYAEVLQETLEDEGFFDSTNDLKKISNNASHLLQLINGILDIAKIEAGQIALDSRATNIEKLATRAAETIEPLAKKNGNTLSVNTHCTTDEITIDGTKLYQIMINLLGNAAKFTSDGLIEFYVASSLNQLIISVKDTGIGISEEQQQLVFEPFRQADGSESREFVGTGLGLTITLQLTKLLNGHIDLKSTPGEGSEFTITIPLKSTDTAMHG